MPDNFKPLGRRIISSKFSPLEFRCDCPSMNTTIEKETEILIFPD
jgi:hypothetical protein